MTKARSSENPVEKLKSILNTLDQVITTTEKIKIDHSAVEVSARELETSKQAIIDLVKSAQAALQNFRLGGTLASIASSSVGPEDSAPEEVDDAAVAEEDNVEEK